MKNTKFFIWFCITSMIFPLLANAENPSIIENVIRSNAIRSEQRNQRKLEDAEMKRVAIKDNWCAMSNIQKNLVNYINQELVPIPVLTNLKKQVESLESPVTELAYTDNDRLRTIFISCSAILHFVDGTKSELTGFTFPMNY